MDVRLLKRARSFAAQRGSSVSAMLAEELQRMLTRETEYERAKARALALLDAPFRLGGGGIQNRDALHDRQNLR